MSKLKLFKIGKEKEEENGKLSFEYYEVYVQNLIGAKQSAKESFSELTDVVIKDKELNTLYKF